MYNAAESATPKLATEQDFLSSEPLYLSKLLAAREEELFKLVKEIAERVEKHEVAMRPGEQNILVKLEFNNIVAAYKTWLTNKRGDDIAEAAQKIHLRHWLTHKDKDGSGEVVWKNAHDNLKNVAICGKEVEEIKKRISALQNVLAIDQLNKDSSIRVEGTSPVVSSRINFFNNNSAQLSSTNVKALVEYHQKLINSQNILENTFERKFKRLTVYVETWDPGLLIKIAKALLAFLEKVKQQKPINKSEEDEINANITKICESINTHTCKLAKAENLLEKVNKQIEEVKQRIKKVEERYAEIIAEKGKLREKEDELKKQLNETDSTGKTRLHRAVLSNDVEHVRQLLECNASLTIPDRNGCLALHLACMDKNIDSKIIDCLLKKIADTQKYAVMRITDRFGRTALMCYKEFRNQIEEKSTEEELQRMQQVAEIHAQDQIILQAVRGITKDLLERWKNLDKDERGKQQTISYITDAKKITFENIKNNTSSLSTSEKELLNDLLEECFDSLIVILTYSNNPKLEDTAIGNLTIFMNQIEKNVHKKKNELLGLASLYFYNVFILQKNSGQASPFSSPRKMRGQAISLPADTLSNIIEEMKKIINTRDDLSKKKKQKLLKNMDSFCSSTINLLPSNASMKRAGNNSLSPPIISRGRKNSAPQCLLPSKADEKIHNNITQRKNTAPQPMKKAELKDSTKNHDSNIKTGQYISPQTEPKAEVNKKAHSAIYKTSTSKSGQSADSSLSSFSGRRFPPVSKPLPSTPDVAKRNATNPSLSKAVSDTNNSPKNVSAAHSPSLFSTGNRLRRADTAPLVRPQIIDEAKPASPSLQKNPAPPPESQKSSSVQEIREKFNKSLPPTSKPAPLTSSPASRRNNSSLQQQQGLHVTKSPPGSPVPTNVSASFSRAGAGRFMQPPRSDSSNVEKMKPNATKPFGI